VDTHADLHVAAALDPLGGLLGVREFRATAAGYARLLGWLGGFGAVALAGVEGTGSYGAGLARHLAAAGIRVVEVDRADRQDRHGRASPIRWMRSARRGPRSPAGHRARRRAVMARWRRSGR
jgi:transposase